MTDTYEDQEITNADFPLHDRKWEIEGRIQRLKELVREAGGNKAASSKSGVPLATLNTYLRDREMSLPALVSIATAFDVRLDWLVLGEGPMRGAQQQSQTMPPLERDNRLFPNVNMDVLGKSAEKALELFHKENGAPNGRQLMQVVTLLYDQAFEQNSIKKE